MSGRWRVAAAAVLLGLPVAAAAERVVDYAIDEATAARYAVEQGVALAPLPVRGSTHVALAIAPAVDHEVVRAGIYCSSWTVQNPVSVLIRRFVAAWDRDGASSVVGAANGASPAGLLVRVDRAVTVSRCLGTGLMKSACITRVTIEGSATRPGEAARPFRVERELPTKAGAACAGLTRGIGLVSRDAASALVAELGRPAPVDSPRPGA